jgi:creatinine amidohydrolase
MAWPAIRDTKKQGDCVILLPIGAVEAHGPHLPVNTDVIIAGTTADRVAEHLQGRGVSGWVAPGVAYSVSWVGRDFPGTMPIDAEIFGAYLEAVIKAIQRLQPAAIVVVNAHLEPEHIEAISGAVARTDSVDCRVIFPDQRLAPWCHRLSPEFSDGQRHGGSYETSLVLASRPDLVEVEALATLPPVRIDLPGRLLEGATTFQEAGGVDGYFGNPAEASAEEGDRLYGVLVEMVITSLAACGVIPR